MPQLDTQDTPVLNTATVRLSAGKPRYVKVYILDITELEDTIEYMCDIVIINNGDISTSNWYTEWNSTWNATDVVVEYRRKT